MAGEKNNALYDGFLELDAGIHSGIATLKLPKNQPAFAANTTFRGGFASSRPVRRKLNLSSNIDALIQDAYAAGLFQCGSKFLPYGGIESLACSIAGRLFQITPDNSGGAGGLEFTIAGDPNPSALSQSWMWQAERWLIIQNGLNNAIAYDGISARRLHPTVSLQATTANDFTIPPIGGTVDITLNAAYTGLLNVTMRLDEIDSGNVVTSAYYLVTKVNGNATQYQVVLKNLGDTSGNNEPGGSSLIIQPANLGNIAAVNSYSPTVLNGYSSNVFPIVSSGTYTQARASINLSSAAPSYAAKNNTVTINGSSWIIDGISTDRITLTLRSGGSLSHPATPVRPEIGQNVILQNYNAPNTTVGTLASLFVSPPTGQNVTAYLVSQFFQNPGTVLFINNKQYQVVSSAVSPPAPSASVTVENINDSGTGTVKAGSKFYNLPELPPGRMGAYGMGRSWQALIDGFSFIAGDLSGSSSGSPIYQNRDAVLKVTENARLAGGGSFSVPGNSGDIRAMLFTATLDVSLGQGPLQVFTSQNIFSCQTPVDRTTWQNLTNPILTESLIGSGCSGQSAAINSNADIFFRTASNDVRSLNLARRDFYRWGDTPIDYEIKRIIRNEDSTMMPWCSTITFDNRMLMTCTPFQSGHGVAWTGLIALNFDQIGGVNEKTGLFYDGLWTDLNILQLVKFDTVNRAFAFVHNATTNKIEVWEFLKGADSIVQDNSANDITWQFESPLLFYKMPGKGIFDLVSLEDGEVYIGDIRPGQGVTITVEYRPDFSDCWFPWYSFPLCNDENSKSNLYGSRLGLGKPDASKCNTANDTTSSVGRWFQVRVTVTGHCIFYGLRAMASIQPEPRFSKIICNV